MNKIHVLIIALFLNPSHNALGDADTDEDSAQPTAIINSLLNFQFSSETSTSEGLSHLIFGDVNRDGQPDAIVTYSLGIGEDGGNQYSQRIALILHGQFGWEVTEHFRVGSKGRRFLKPLKVNNGIIEFEVSFWQDGDGACCPSGHSTTSFIYEDSGLREL